MPLQHEAAEVDQPTVSVIIPTLNEAANLPHVFAKLPGDVDEVIVVDGHSVDDTVEVARALRPDVAIVRQNRSRQGQRARVRLRGRDAATSS